MPYGIPKKKGGESKKNVVRMEKCVQSVMKAGYAKENAIAICKARLGFRK